MHDNFNGSVFPGMVLAAVLVAGLVSVAAYKASVDGENTPEYQAKREAEHRQSVIDHISNRMTEKTVYVRDITTGICFARTTSGHGLGLATVDCNLLSNVDVIEFASKTKGQ